MRIRSRKKNPENLAIKTKNRRQQGHIFINTYRQDVKLIKIYIYILYLKSVTALHKKFSRTTASKENSPK